MFSRDAVHLCHLIPIRLFVRWYDSIEGNMEGRGGGGGKTSFLVSHVIMFYECDCVFCNQACRLLGDIVHAPSVAILQAVTRHSFPMSHQRAAASVIQLAVLAGILIVVWELHSITCWPSGLLGRTKMTCICQVFVLLVLRATLCFLFAEHEDLPFVAGSTSDCTRIFAAGGAAGALSSAIDDEHSIVRIAAVGTRVTNNVFRLLVHRAELICDHGRVAAAHRDHNCPHSTFGHGVLPTFECKPFGF
jgi:hypothetical protein